MRYFVRGLFCLQFFLGIAVLGQIKITSPVERMIVQRNISGECDVVVTGTYSQKVDKVELRAVEVIPGQGINTDWATLDANPAAGLFKGTVKLKGGWYSLQVRGYYKNELIAQDFVQRFGVGEVFIIAGQSNVQGLRGTTTKGAEEDRVNFISNYDNVSNSLFDPPAPLFSQLTAAANPSPRGQTSWCWGVLGDILVRRLNVPVLFINTAWEGTNIANWYESSQGRTTYNAYGGFAYPERMPYDNLRLSIQHFASRLGTRAILWMNGETDNYPSNTSRQDYVSRFVGMINTTNAYSSLRWVIARTSRTQNTATGQSVTSQTIIDAQNEIVTNPLYSVYPGPETDNLLPFGRPDGVHLSTLEGLDLLANAWAGSLSNQFFSEVTPTSPAGTLSVGVVCNSTNNGIVLTLPEGYLSYAWNTGETGRTITVSGAGEYYAVMKNNLGNAVFSQKVTLVANAQPVTPTIIPAGSQQACANEGIELSASGGTDTFNWYLNASTTSSVEGKNVTVRESGDYRVRATNVFGCTSSISNPSNLTIRSAMSTPTIAGSGPYSLAANITETGLGESYEWRENGTLLQQTGPIVKVSDVAPNTPTTYSVRSKATYTLGANSLTCYSPFSEEYVYTSKIGDEIVVFPNPGEISSTQIESKDVYSNVSVSIFSISGQRVYFKEFSTFNGRLSLENLRLLSGVYLVKFQGTGINATKRLVIR